MNRYSCADSPLNPARVISTSGFSDLIDRALCQWGHWRNLTMTTHGPLGGHYPRVGGKRTHRLPKPSRRPRAKATGSSTKRDGTSRLTFTRAPGGTSTNGQPWPRENEVPSPPRDLPAAIAVVMAMAGATNPGLKIAKPHGAHHD